MKRLCYWAALSAVIACAPLWGYADLRPTVDRAYTMKAGIDCFFDEYNGYYAETTLVPYGYAGHSDSEFTYSDALIAPFFSYRLSRIEARVTLPLLYSKESLTHIASAFANTNTTFSFTAVDIDAKIELIDWYISLGAMARAHIPVNLGYAIAERIRYRGSERITNYGYNDAKTRFNVIGGLALGIVPKVAPINLYGAVYAQIGEGTREYFIGREGIEIVTSTIARAVFGIEHIRPWNLSETGYSEDSLFLSFDIKLFRGLFARTSFTKTLAGRFVDNHRIFGLSFYYAW